MLTEFTYVEDYMEFIAGWRTRSGKALQLFQNVASPLALARYDVRIVDSLSMQTILDNRPYTDKQAELAKRIVFKYRRQLANLTEPLMVPDTLENFRLGVRQVDRTKSASVHDGVIWLRFPYDTEIIGAVKEFSKKSQGSLHWDNQNKVWKMALTEYNIGLVMTYFKSREFEISQEIEQLFEKVLECEQHPYKIELVNHGDKYTVTNAEDSLLNHLEKTLGDDCWTDLIRLCDYAEIYGYEISEGVKKELDQLVKNKLVRQLICHKKFGVTLGEFKHVVEYARLVNRLPLHYYTSTILPEKSSDSIVYLGSSTKLPVDYKINLLVTESSYMIGNRKQQWLQSAEKIIDIL